MPSSAACRTIREISKKSHVSVGAISEIMSGERGLTAKMASRLVGSLAAGAERKRLLETNERMGGAQRLFLPEHAYALITKWFYFAIISLLQLDDPPTSASELSRLLHLPVKAEDEAVEKLIEFNSIHRNDEGDSAIYWCKLDHDGRDQFRPGPYGEQK